jgi:hypothetical protein
VRIKPIVGVGGGTGESDSIQSRLTRAIGSFLSSTDSRVETVEASKENQSVTPYTLEGEASALPVDGSSGATYLLTVRLSKSDSAGRTILLGHFSGYARTILDISDNANRDKRVDSRGLLGELSKRIDSILLAQKASTTSFQLDQVIKNHCQEDRRVRAKLVRPKKGEVGYRLHVESPYPGPVYVVSADNNGSHLLAGPESLAVKNGKFTENFPKDRRFSFDGPTTIYVIVAEQKPTVTPIKGRPLRFANIRADDSQGQSKPLPYEIIGTPMPEEIYKDSALNQFLQTLQKPVEGHWHVAKLRLR